MQCKDATIDAAVAGLIAVLPGVDSDQRVRLRAAVKLALMMVGYAPPTAPRVLDGLGSTEEFAADKNVKPRSVLHRYYKTGSYFGVKPVKAENGRLEWPMGNAK